MYLKIAEAALHTLEINMKYLKRYSTTDIINEFIPM
jgi:hypothetical protein